MHFCPLRRLVEDILQGLDSDLPDEARAYVKKMCVYTCKGELLSPLSVPPASPRTLLREVSSF